MYFWQIKCAAVNIEQLFGCLEYGDRAICFEMHNNHILSLYGTCQRCKIASNKIGRTLASAAAVFKVNIGTLICWSNRYRATGNVKMQVRRPVNKKIIPEKHAPFDNIEQVYEFSIVQIARLRTSHCNVTSSETEFSEQV